MDVSDKVAVITGSARGIGRAYAERLLQAGARVCLSDLDKVKGEDTLKELGERFVKEKVCFSFCDVTKEEDLKSLLDKAEEYFNVSCVDIMVNNAGVNVNLGWRICMNINIMAVLNGTMIATERMKKTDKPCQIINTASIAGLTMGIWAEGVDEAMTPYTVSKHGVVAMTRSMSLSNNNIMHKAICPDTTNTELVAAAGQGLDPKMLEEGIAMLGGLMTPEFVAEGFFRLVTQCSNGSIMLVRKDSPYILMPEVSKPLVLVMSSLAKQIGRLTSTDMVTGTHLTLVIMLGILIFCALLSTIF